MERYGSEVALIFLLGGIERVESCSCRTQRFRDARLITRQMVYKRQNNIDQDINGNKSIFCVIVWFWCNKPIRVLELSLLKL